MTTVFISGSREIPCFPDESKVRIDRIMQQSFDVVVGDSERGVDAQVIKYLSECGYPYVTVYTVHDRPRAKGIHGSWKVHRVYPTIEKRIGSDGRVRNAQELETVKDEAMGDVSDYGLVIWRDSFINRFGRKSASKGSLRNMYQLLSTGKPVVLYMLEDEGSVGPSFNCFELRHVDELRDLIEKRPAVVQNAYKDVARKQKHGARGRSTGMQLKIQDT